MQSLDFFRLNKNGKKVIGPNDELSTHMLREYAKAMHKAQKDGKRAPKSAAESIPFESMEEDGLMCLSKKRYSIMLEFSDMNYIQADEHVQKDMWSESATVPSISPPGTPIRSLLSGKIMNMSVQMRFCPRRLFSALFPI